jgi:hypothetical protein
MRVRAAAMILWLVCYPCRAAADVVSPPSVKCPPGRDRSGHKNSSPKRGSIGATMMRPSMAAPGSVSGTARSPSSTIARQKSSMSSFRPRARKRTRPIRIPRGTRSASFSPTPAEYRLWVVVHDSRGERRGKRSPSTCSELHTEEAQRGNTLVCPAPVCYD